MTVRQTILKMLYRSGASHLGSNMSMVEILLGIYSHIDLDKVRGGAPDRARVLISKGHSAAAVYAVLTHFGVIERAELDRYHSNGSNLTGHVNHMVDGVEHSTGALGHGANVAVGCALGLKSRGLDAPVFAVLGDGELQEGSVWEAFMYAVHKKLNNLVFMIDNNRISSITATEDVISMNPLAQRFAGFGLSVHEVNGHDLSQLIESIETCLSGSKPSVIVCNTIKGKDIPFAEGEPIWHYKSLSKENFEDAMRYLSGIKS